MILAAGCFDGLSGPQVRYLQAARRLDPWGTLIVTIVPDRYIREHKQRAPYWCQADRAHVVKSLGCVDDVYMQGEHETVPDVIRALEPETFVKGPEWQNHLDEEHMQACQDAGTEIVFTADYGPHWSEVR